ncbi:UNVERIFIED_CONTAM: hypothetical protein BEN50_10650 [Euhalothece sp. KZN 001]
MKINIFGVGRSGTKAVQLYITYLLAQKYNYVWLNYEPFRYQTRKLGAGFRRGMQLHQNIPLFLENNTNEFNREQEFKRFCDDLIASHEVVVSKFIRGNGRISLINEYTKPDLSFLIVRDLYSILRSSAKANWCVINKREWESFLREVNQIYPKFKPIPISYFSDKLYLVAIYWYVMIKYALENAKKIIVINYDELNRIQDYCCENIDTIDIDIRSSLFQGKRIHDDYLIQDCTFKKTNKSKQILSGVKNKIQRKIFKDFSYEKIGNLVMLNPNCTQTDESSGINEKLHQTKIEVPSQPLFEDLSAEINELLLNRKQNQI